MQVVDRLIVGATEAVVTALLAVVPPGGLMALVVVVLGLKKTLHAPEVLRMLSGGPWVQIAVVPASLKVSLGF